MDLEILDTLYDIRSHAKQLLLYTGPNSSIVRSHARDIKSNCDYTIANLDSIFLKYMKDINENNTGF